MRALRIVCAMEEIALREQFSCVREVLDDLAVQALAEQSGFKWKRYQPVNGVGDGAFAVIGRNAQGMPLHFLFMLDQGAAAPEHIHFEGELIYLIWGEMTDVNARGEAVLLKAGNMLIHGWESVHQPGTQAMANSFCLGYYVQPGGMKLVEREAESATATAS